jgi:hypothetical protein
MRVERQATTGVAENWSRREGGRSDSCVFGEEKDGGGIRAFCFVKDDTRLS